MQTRKSKQTVESNRRCRQRNRAIINEAKDVPCTDCNRRYPPRVMDFHHVLGTKDACLGNLWRAASEARIRAEIAKCEVVCANCHRLRHSQETD